jgi:tRNA A37 threonylcarbamoyladenosine biosynthesis protein TsaE
MKTYLATHPTWKRLVHIDAYRLERPEEADVLGFDALIDDPQNIILVEWPEHIAKALDTAKPPLYLRFRVPEGASAHTREIEFS